MAAAEKDRRPPKDWQRRQTVNLGPATTMENAGQQARDETSTETAKMKIHAQRQSEQQAEQERVRKALQTPPDSGDSKQEEVQHGKAQSSDREGNEMVFNPAAYQETEEEQKARWDAIKNARAKFKAQRQARPESNGSSQW